MSRVKVDIIADKSGLDSALKGVEHSLEGLKSMVVGAFSVEAVRSIIEKTFEYADTIDKASLRMKMTTEQTQALSIVAKEAGTSLETVEEAFRKIEAARAKALGGDAASLKAFKALGVSTADLSKSNNTIGLAGQLSSAARSGSNDVQGVALGQLGLRRTAGDLAALGDSLKDFDSKVNELKDKGAIIPDEDIANIVRAKEEIEMLGTQAMARIAPIISQIIEGIEEGYIVLETTAENVFTAIILMGQNAVEFIRNLKDQLTNNGKNIIAGAVAGYAKGGLIGAAVGAVTTSDKKGNSLGSVLVDYQKKQADTVSSLYETNNHEIASKIDQYINGLAKNQKDRAAARTSPNEVAGKVIPPVRERRLYSDALTSTGNLIGQSFQGAGNVAASLDVQQRQLNSLNTIADTQGKQTDLLSTIATNTAQDSSDDWQ